jgi:lactate dehydrogenase-like 2-hydroxyacid dehydrogenase
MVTPVLLAMEQVVLLLLLGSAPVETRSAIGLRAVANIDAFTDGRPCPDAV